MQDKCYPDRTCAELSGLPREICTGEAVKLAPMGLKIACSAVRLSGAIGDRTVQIPSFVDILIPAPSQFSRSAKRQDAAGVGMDHWRI